MEARQFLDQLLQTLPRVRMWIDEYLEAHAALAVPVKDLGFRRLPQYYSQSRLSASKAVKVDRVQVPPLSKMGVTYFTHFEETLFDGITYMDTFFLAPRAHNDEPTYFHELVHVVQWEVLGPDSFLILYAIGLQAHGYENSPLERIAYEFEGAFRAGLPIPQLERRIQGKTMSVAKT